MSIEDILLINDNNKLQSNISNVSGKNPNRLRNHHLIPSMQASKSTVLLNSSNNSEMTNFRASNDVCIMNNCLNHNLVSSPQSLLNGHV